MKEKTYRTIHWGKDVQIWMTEKLYFRSPNNMPDGPKKTILGKEQLAWLKRTMQESDATYKFLITPGPIVGPDKRGRPTTTQTTTSPTRDSNCATFSANSITPTLLPVTAIGSIVPRTRKNRPGRNGLRSDQRQV
jgi:phosphodiesterase/alkaline phosphatase D-like protein